MQLKREREGNGSFLMILAQISKYQDCYSVLNMLLEILCHFGISKSERPIKTNAKSQTQGREFQPRIRVHSFHSCGKERHCKERQDKEKEQQQTFAGNTFTLDIPL